MQQSNPEGSSPKKSDEITRRQFLELGGRGARAALGLMITKALMGCAPEGASEQANSETDAKTVDAAALAETEQKSYEPYTVQPGEGWLNVLSQWEINVQLITDENGKRWSLSDQQLAKTTVVAMKEDPQQPGRTIKESEATLSQAINGGMPLVPGLTLYLGDSEIPEASTVREIQAQPATYTVKELDNINSLLQQYLQENKLAESNSVRNVTVRIESKNPSVKSEFTVDELTSLSPDETNIWPGDKIVFSSPYPIQE